jgi:tetrahydromethanopterin S-methyltransferase subunit B
MRSTCSLLAVVLSVLMAAPRTHASSAGPDQSAAQMHIARQSQLDAAVQEHTRAADRDRDAVRSFLQRDDVRAIAGKYGVDIRRAESAVAAMDASELAQIAAQAREADEALAGGQSRVTISTTTIIIALLVLILLIVALG